MAREMWLAYITSENPNLATQTCLYVAVGETKAAAETAMPEILDNIGFTIAQITRMLNRMKTQPMGKKTHGFTQRIYIPKDSTNG